MLRAFAAGCVLTAALLSGVTLATPFPSIEAQLDIDGNCAVNFGDTIKSAKITLGVEPMPTWLPTCPEWYATPTP